MIIVLRTGDAIAEVAARRGEFFGWMRDTVGVAWPGAWHEHDVRAGAPNPGFEGVTAFVITGSASSVTERAPWMLRAEAYIREIHAAQIPLLGICFGHQLIAQALGGDVQKNPRGREIGTVRARRVHADGDDDTLLDGLGREFLVNATHVDSVVQLPPGARLLLATDLEPHAAFAVGPYTRAVQFHPEIDGDVMRGYVRARAVAIDSEGLCHKTIHDAVVDAPEGRHILANFAKGLVARREPHAA